jgi:hypothetical protein
MRTKVLTIAALMLLAVVEVPAQGWLGKALKAVDQAAKKLDEATTKVDDAARGVTATQVTDSDYAGATVKCTNKNFDITFESCIRNGSTITLTYYITNKSADVTIEYWGRNSMPDGQTKTTFFDSEGNEYKWKNLTVGKTEYHGLDWLMPVTFPEGVKIKCSIVLANVDTKATKLARATVSGWDFYLQFNNVPIADAAVEAPIKTAAPALTLTKQGVSCLKNGVAFGNIPSNCPGFYDRYKVNLIEDEMDGDYNEIIFYAGAEKVAEMNAPPFLSDFTVQGVTVYSPNVSTPDGVSPGMPLSKLAAYKGLDSDNQGNPVLGGFSIGIAYEDLTEYGQKTKDDAYLNGTTWKLTSACFKTGAKVQYISNY